MEIKVFVKQFIQNKTPVVCLCLPWIMVAIELHDAKIKKEEACKNRVLTKLLNPNRDAKIRAETEWQQRVADWLCHRQRVYFLLLTCIYIYSLQPIVWVNQSLVFLATKSAIYWGEPHFHLFLQKSIKCMSSFEEQELIRMSEMNTLHFLCSSSSISVIQCSWRSIVDRLELEIMMTNSCILF